MLRVKGHTCFKVSAIIIGMVLVNPKLVVGIEVPFNRGINLTNWLQSKGSHEIHFTRYGISDLRDIRDLGFDVVRLPINLHSMVDGSPDYSLDPLFLFFLDQIIDWCEELDLYLIIDNHSFDNDFNINPNIEKTLISIWRQLSEHLKNRSDLVHYEVLNEPHGIDDLVWGRIQGKVIDVIRSIDKNRIIVVGPANWNSFKNLSLMPDYSDPRLIYTFHFYEPFLFTHQGASWVTPSMASVTGIPFPHKSTIMPRVPSELAGTWVGGAYSSYFKDSKLTKIEEQINIAANFAKVRDVPIFCGEFGVFRKNAPIEDRKEWYKAVRLALETREIPWVLWDYKGGFGLFTKGSNELYDFDLNIDLLSVLDLNVPPQLSWQSEPFTEGKKIYGDFIGSNIDASVWSTGSVDFYSSNNPIFGDYCIRWSDAEQYNHIRFDFIPDIDLELLEQKGYLVSFWVKGSKKISSFDIRFLNDQDTQLPWRMRSTIDSTKVVLNNVWQEVRVPLSAFVEHGAWDEVWYEPEGLFDWSSVDCFEIVSEHQSFDKNDLYIDELKLVSEDGTNVNRIEETVVMNHLFENFPNPFNSNTLIEYSIESPDFVSLEIYNALGQKVCTVVNQDMPAGKHQAIWNGKDDYGREVSTGLYFYRMKVVNYMGAGKMMLLR